MCDLIVNADDFGLSQKVNEGILKAHLHGILTSTSIMANGLAFEHAISICHSYPSLDVGVHLTLVEERPVLDLFKIGSLVDGGGRLHHHASKFVKRYMFGRINLSEVKQELEAQVTKVLDHGVAVSHLDSHQHLHMLPEILNIVVDLAKKYSIPYIRFTHEQTRLVMFMQQQMASRVLQLWLLNSISRFGKSRVVLRTDHFVGFIFSGKMHKENLIKTLMCVPRSGTCELMCHPGLDDPDTHYRHWGYHWAEELSALTDPEVMKVIDQRGIRLISFRQNPSLRGRIS